MFTQIVNKEGNTYFEYDFKGCPFRYVEVRHIPKDINLARRAYTLDDPKDHRRLVRRWAEAVPLEYYFPVDRVEKMRRTGIPLTGYAMHHMHPCALGGYVTSISNLTMIPEPLHDMLHEFLRDCLVARCVPMSHIAHEVPDGRKVFMALPILPPVVTKRDVPFVFGEPSSYWKDVKTSQQMIDDYLEKYPCALYVPKAVLSERHRGSKNLFSWPKPVLTRTAEHRIHHTSSVSVRHKKRWSFNEWLAHERQKQGYER